MPTHLEAVFEDTDSKGKRHRTISNMRSAADHWASRGARLEHATQEKTNGAG